MAIEKMFRNFKSIGTTIAFIVIVVAVLTLVSNEIRLYLDHHFTIGYTNGSHKTSKGVIIEYYFVINKVKYKGSRDALKYEPVSEGGRYFVKFLPNDPSVNRILWDKPVPEQIQLAPIDGWRDISFLGL
jgi:hypothetical protein